ncbi:MAG: glycosyltransferase [Pseudanabaenaceae cyanobacterium SKYGB_i_bin29]|nr:glycosyltransferase [Pseudanabaenaceae cyanobacterium SKYG29]MDW8422150.1 glycosyltransferase [Pseudanabaenaceae cyanobacterium SKYGB_i_bin29]
MTDVLEFVLSVLPLNAKQILEIGRTELREKYLPFNPDCQFAQVTEELIDLPNLDAIVCTDLTDIKGKLSFYLQYLKPEGEIFLPFANSQCWQHIIKTIEGKSEPGHTYSAQQICQMVRDLGLMTHEIIRQDLPAPQQQSFQQFLQQILPLVNLLQISLSEFQYLSASPYLIVRALKQPCKQPKLLIQTCITAPIGCDRVRVLDPDRFSRTLINTRVHQVRLGQSIPLNLAAPDECKVFIWQRALLLYPQDIHKQKLLKDRGYLIVAEHDDDPYFWPENADNKFLLFWSSHCIQTSTESLAKHLQQFNNPYIKVFRNQLTYLPPKREYKEGYSVNLFFGALNRQADWEPIMPTLNKILARHKQVYVKVIHDRQFFDALATNRKEFHPFLPYEKYQEILHTCDIGILPLQDTQFNRMKSDLKFLEHAGHGVVALASPTVYAQSIVEGITGMIYHSAEEFGEKLTELIQNAKLRHRIADNAYHWVRENRLLCQHFTERREWYVEMYNRLPELNEALRERCPQMFS